MIACVVCKLNALRCADLYSTVLLHASTAANLASDPWSNSADSSSSARGLLGASVGATASTTAVADAVSNNGDVRAGMRGQPTELALLVAAAKVLYYHLYNTSVIPLVVMYA
jgi:hypothetical protein